MVKRDVIENVVIFTSVVSCLFSLFVMMTFFMFSDMRKKMFMRYIFYISLSDFLMSFSSVVGFPDDGSVLCWVQGLMQGIFAVSSWFWTTALSYSLYSIIRFGKVRYKQYQVHLVCWGLPVILAIIPLSTERYGSSSVDLQWCVFVGKSNGWTLFWSYASFFGWMFLCIVLMLTWHYHIHITMAYRSESLTEIVRNTYRKVSLYPVAMIMCWTLNYLSISIIPAEHDPHLLVALSMLFAISYGIVTSCIFMAKSEEAQRRWYDLLFSGWFWFRPSLTQIPIDFAADESLSSPLIASGTSNPFSNSSGRSLFSVQSTLSSNPEPSGLDDHGEANM